MPCRSGDLAGRQGILNYGQGGNESMKRLRKYLELLVCVVPIMVIVSCNTGLEPSPEPALLRVILQADPADTTIVIGDDVFFASEGDSMSVSVSQGNVYLVDSSFATLHKDTIQYLDRTYTYNLLRRDNGFMEYPIFESYVPPGDYNRLEFILKADYVLLTYGFAIGGIGVPMESPPEENELRTFHFDFTMKAGEVTEILIYLMPFESVDRYQDIFRFTPVFEIANVENKGTYQ